MRNFVLIGAAGYIAPRHMEAIKATGNNLLAGLDKHDSVGILDSYFPNAAFFTEFERFDRHLEKLKRSGKLIDYVSVCSPNYLHDAHCRFGLRHGADVICEKPLVINPWNLDGLREIEVETGKKIFTIMQLRLHPAIIALKQQVDQTPADQNFDVELTYITSRGKWYHYSWKGEEAKSGGITTNIGIHFFDMLIWIFGDVLESKVTDYGKSTAAGSLRLERATVNWLLSVDNRQLPDHIQELGMRTYRNLSINQKEVNFSDGFTGLHTRSYEKVLNGKGLRIGETSRAIQLVHDIRSASLKL